jgi:hypothetical protein
MPEKSTMKYTSQVRGGRTPAGEHASQMLLLENRAKRASAVHYAAKAIGKRCSIEDDDATQNAIIEAFILADSTGRGIVDQDARRKANEYAAELPPPPEAA